MGRKNTMDADSRVVIVDGKRKKERERERERLIYPID